MGGLVLLDIFYDITKNFANSWTCQPEDEDDDHCDQQEQQSILNQALPSLFRSKFHRIVPPF